MKYVGPQLTYQKVLLITSSIRGIEERGGGALLNYLALPQNVILKDKNMA